VAEQLAARVRVVRASQLAPAEKSAAVSLRVPRLAAREEPAARLVP